MCIYVLDCPLLEFTFFYENNNILHPRISENYFWITSSHTDK